MQRLATTRAFTGVIIAAWAAYFTLICLTNGLDALKALGVLGSGWDVASGNFPFLQETTDVYATPDPIDALLFGGVILWEGLAAVLFWRALRDRSTFLAAATAGLALWAAFVVFEEVFLAYEVEATHWRLFIALVVSTLAVELLGERER